VKSLLELFSYSTANAHDVL